MAKQPLSTTVNPSLQSNSSILSAPAKKKNKIEPKIAENKSETTMSMDREERAEALRRFMSLLGTESGTKQKTPQINMVVGGGNNSSPGMSKNHDFCSMSPRISAGAPERATLKAFQKYLDPNSQMGIGAVCSFPSLDLYSGEVTELPLPNVGVSHKATQPSTSPKKVIPSMAASVYSTTSGKDAANANANAAVLEQAAARNLGSITTWTRSTVHLAPSTMLRSLAQSMVSLVDSRVRAWTLLLLRKSLSSGDTKSRAGLLKLLATSHSLCLSSVVTKFQALGLPPVSKADIEQSPDEIVLPLLFEALFIIVIQEEEVPVKLRTPGIVTGHFASDTILLSSVKISLDTNALVASMVEQARLTVFKAVALATSFTTGGGVNKASASPASTLSQFNSALNLSQRNNGSTASLRKATSTSNPQSSSSKEDNMKDISTEQHRHHIQNQTTKHSMGPPMPVTRSLSLCKARKTRSVTWEPKLETQPEAKRRKISQPDALKASRSFGKPEAGIFESNRNATFAEFGRAPMQYLSKATNSNTSKHLHQHAASKSMVNFRHQPSSDNDSVTSLTSLANNTSRPNAVFSAASLSLSKRLTDITTTKYSKMSKANASAAVLPIPSSQNNNKGMSSNATVSSNESSGFQVPQPRMPRTLSAFDKYTISRNASKNSLSVSSTSSSQKQQQLLQSRNSSNLSLNRIPSKHALTRNSSRSGLLPRTPTALEGLLLDRSKFR